MFTLYKTLSKLLTPSLPKTPEQDEAFLAEAVDLNDLEHRMRLLDEGHRTLFAPPPHGIFVA